MPFNAAFFNYVVPLLIGARDVAFPRLNALSYWIFLAGGLLLNASLLAGTPPDVGWFGYANLTSRHYTPGPGVDFWLLSLQILGVSSVIAAINFIVTILNMRAPGMTMMRMPVFVWMTLVTSFLLLFAMPVIAVALFQLTFDRLWHSTFYNAVAGGDPLLWQRERLRPAAQAHELLDVPAGRRVVAEGSRRPDHGDAGDAAIAVRHQAPARDRAHRFEKRFAGIVAGERHHDHRQRRNRRGGRGRRRRQVVARS